ncbi:MAG: FCD domain-containing protein [Clostridiales Family XIII bacterium]|jgi:DNA-binding FadR family transcriptional regulator|nr:FCD domain-containing protein [Clostridiales Family XIII bacterium]
MRLNRDDDSKNLKEHFVTEMIEQILTGKLSVGQKLPSERIISEQMGISRNVVRVGLAELTTKGFLHTEARRGTFVNDYIREGNLLTLEAVRSAQVPTTPLILRSMLDFRMAISCDAAALGARRRSEDDLVRLAKILDEQAQLNNDENETFARLDFLYHKEIYIVSGNIVYPMIQNSIFSMHHELALAFYKALSDKDKIKRGHCGIYNAIRDQDENGARKWMQDVLELGTEVLAKLSYFS